jgi:biopolymer transport protein ExbD
MGLKKQSKVSAEFNMSSLTDIIFLLLIFFMLTSSLVSPTAINLQLPGPGKDKAKVTTTESYNIKADKNARLSLNAKAVELDAMDEAIARVVRKDGRDAKDILFILDIHEQVDAQTLVTLVDLLNKEGVKMVLTMKKK